MHVCRLVIPLLAVAYLPGRPDGNAKDSFVGGCSLIGCADGFSGSFSPPFTAAGEYVVTADIDGQESTRAGRLPLGEDWVGEGDLQLSLSGSALPDDQHSLPGFFLPQAGFSTLEMTVTHDGMEVARWSLSPDWEVIQPNGPGCGPTCTVAGASLSWP